MILKVILLFLALLLIPICLGQLYTKQYASEKSWESWLFADWAIGMVFAFAIFEIMTVPAIFLHSSLTRLSFCYIAVVSAVAVVAVLWARSHVLESGRGTLRWFRGLSWMAILAIFVIALQMGIYVLGMHEDADDAFYLGTASTTLHTDTLYRFNPYTGDAYRGFPARYVLSPFPLWFAMLSRIFGLHPVFLAHTLWPVLVLPAIYAVIAMLGRRLFYNDRRKTACFVLIFSVLQIFSYTSTHTQGTVMLLRIWQGKAVLASFLLPLVFYQSYKLYFHPWKRTDWLFTTCLMLACCMVSSMGIILGPVGLGIGAVVAAVRSRDVTRLVSAACCCIPNIVLAAVYILIR